MLLSSLITLVVCNACDSDFQFKIHNVLEDSHRFNVQPGLDSASALVNGSNFCSVNGVDTYFSTGSHAFQEPNGAMSTTVFDAGVVLSVPDNKKFFDSLRDQALVLFRDPAVQATNASKMSSGQVNIKMWKHSNKLTSMFCLKEFMLPR